MPYEIKNVIIIFNLILNKCIISGLEKSDLEYEIINEQTKYSTLAYVDYILDNKTGLKWVFSWELWGKEQFFRIEQYTPPNLFTLDTLGYIPPIDTWITLAIWSYIAKPNLCTIQTDNVYNSLYVKKAFPNIIINFKVIGSPIKDWNTLINIKGHPYNSN